MSNSAFFEVQFVLLIASSLILPVGIYGYLFRKRTISRSAVLIFSSILILLSATDVYLLQSLRELADSTLSTVDDKIFSSELSVALYVLPAIFAGIAVNLVSHLLNKHLDEAERKFEKAHRPPLQVNLTVLHGSKKSQFAAKRNFDGRPRARPRNLLSDVESQ